MKKKGVYKKNPLFQSCPNCQLDGTLHMSRPRNLIESTIDKLTYFKIYRCRQCGWRSYLSTFNFSAVTFGPVILFIFIVLIISYLIGMILIRLVH